MTNIEFEYKDGVFEISFEGHSGYEEAGKDIVCSAISILSYSLYSYMVEASERGLIEKVAMSARDGYLRYSGRVLDKKAEEGFRPILIGLEEISKNYKKNVHFSPKGKDFNFKDV